MARIDFRNVYKLELDVIPVINKIESRGLFWNSKLARSEDRKIQTKLKALRASDVMAGVNPGSWQQVQRHFLDLGMPEKLLLKKGKLTTGEKQIDTAVRQLENNEKWQHVGSAVRQRVVEFSDVLSDYRHLKKVSSTYLRPFSDVAERTGGIVYASLNPFGAVTGRMSGTFQQMHKNKESATPEQQAVRRCVVCRDGYGMYYFDFGQMEMAIFGLISGAWQLVEAYMEGVDLHLMMAQALYGPSITKDSPERDKTKTTSFAIIYGAGITKMAEGLGVSMSQAKEFLELYYNRFPEIKDYQDELEFELKANGFVEDYYGRRYSLKPGEAYKAVNAVDQGLSASVFKQALVQTVGGLRRDEHGLLVVHDEIILERKMERPGERAFVKRVVDAMQQVEVLTDRGLVLKVDVEKTVTNWAEKQSVDL